MELLTWIRDLKLSTYVDIALMSVLVYVVMIWFKSTRAAFVFTGIIIAVLAYIIVDRFNLIMLTAVLEKFFAVILIALVVIFQEELRSFFERLAHWSFLPGGTRKDMRLNREEVDILARSMQDMARKRIGALIVLKGRDPIARHCQGGIDLNGRLSEQLILSLFDPHSIGHDGAAIIEGGLIRNFSCHLPLSKNLAKIKRAGTRHAAGLGLSENCDAMCLIVSEERGTISIARNGDIETIIDPTRLTYILQRFYQEIYPSIESKNWLQFLIRNPKEKILSLVLSLGMWVVLVRGAEITSNSYRVPISVPPDSLGTQWKVATLHPTNLTVTLRGPYSAFAWLKPRELELLIIPPEFRTGQQIVQLTTNNLIVPKNLQIQSLTTNGVAIQEVNLRLEVPVEKTNSTVETTPP